MEKATGIYLQKELVYAVAQPSGHGQEILALGDQEVEHGGLVFFVERIRPDPSEPPERVRILEGLLGDSDREGYRRLYFTPELDYYAEFRAEDVLFSEPIPSDQPPFLGQEATTVGIRRDATIDYT